MATADIALAVPAPGIFWGSYPQRDGRQARARLAGRNAFGRPSAIYDEILAAARHAASTWRDLSPAHFTPVARELGARLRQRGLAPADIAQALACGVEATRRTIGLDLYDSQIFAAAAMLDNCLAEMATGEGKTCAAALAAGAAALAGIPVHVVTANDYLAGRDAATLAPVYQALGLRCAAVEAGTAPAARAVTYRANVVYCTAKELAFDYLRDALAGGGRRGGLAQRARALAGLGMEAPLLPGLCMAIIDEADSVLIDEASVPLIISQPAASAERRAWLWQSLVLARDFVAGTDFALFPELKLVELSADGRRRLHEMARRLAGHWQNPHAAEEALTTALAALHLYQRDRDYVVGDSGVEIVDPVTGRVAAGRVWSRGLHALIGMKEGCKLHDEMETVAQISFQRFFSRYVRLAGMSGTLRESRAEFRRVYGLDIVPVTLHRPCRRLVLPPRVFADDAARWQAVAARARELAAAGRAVLIGTDSVADSETLSARLDAAGLRHSVLNARQDKEEADIVAAAGLAGSITVATNMAGRGTDIVLGPGVEARGGLHVLSCQRNRERRLDRQLAGRSARQGDAGSCETWFCLEDAPSATIPSVMARFVRKRASSGHMGWLANVFAALFVLGQVLQEARQVRRRRELMARDAEWERRVTFAAGCE